MALKVLIAGEDATAEQVERFAREAQLAARLRHPNIVRIHDVGVHEGKHYFTMDFVEGTPLDQAIGRRGLPPERTLAITLEICDALEHAHGQGIVHRDLKPSNIILDQRGAPQVMDFGLAREVRGGSKKLTRSGASLGTPQYMAPEQAAGQVRLVDETSDVYALGALLYEMLTGRPPFTGSSAMNILFAVINRDPVAPRRINPRIPRDLETICLKAMEKEKSRRYGGARAMANDLRRHLDGRPILARPAGVLYRIRRWVGRNRALAILAGLFVLAGGVGGITASTSSERSREEIARLQVAAQEKEEEARHSAGERLRIERRRALDLRIRAVLAEARRLEANKAEPQLVEKKFQEAVELSGGAIETLLEAGRYRMRRKQHRGAIVWFERVLKEHSGHFLAHFYIYQCHDALGERERGLLYLERIRDLEGENELTWYARAIMHFRKKEHGDAVRCLTRSIAFNKRFREAFEKRGSMLVDLGEYDRARKDLERAIELGSDSYVGYGQMGRMLGKLSRFEEAAAYMVKAADRAPNRQGETFFLNAVAYFYYRARRFRRALAYVDRAIAMRPDSRPLYNLKGSILEAQGRPEEARRIHAEKKWLRTWGNLDLSGLPRPEVEPRLLPMIDRVYRLVGHRGDDAAATIASQLLSWMKEPATRAWALTVRGSCLHNVGDYTRALADFDRALELAPGLVAVNARRAFTRMRLKSYRQALADFDVAVRHFPGKFELLFQHGILLGKFFGRFAAAWRAFEQASRVLPPNTVAFGVHKAMASSSLVLGKYRRALAETERALRHTGPIAASDAGASRLIHAQLLYVLGEYDRALESLRRISPQTAAGGMVSVMQLVTLARKLGVDAAIERMGDRIPKRASNAGEAVLLAAAGRIAPERVSWSAVHAPIAAFFAGEVAAMRGDRSRALVLFREAARSPLLMSSEVSFARRRIFEMTGVLPPLPKPQWSSGAGAGSARALGALAGGRISTPGRLDRTHAGVVARLRTGDVDGALVLCLRLEDRGKGTTFLRGILQYAAGRFGEALIALAGLTEDEQWGRPARIYHFFTLAGRHGLDGARRRLERRYEGLRPVHVMDDLLAAFLATRQTTVRSVTPRQACQTSFFLGEYARLNGLRDEATIRLRHAVETAQYDCPEYGLAVRRLEEMRVRAVDPRGPEAAILKLMAAGRTREALERASRVANPAAGVQFLHAVLLYYWARHAPARAILRKLAGTPGFASRARAYLFLSVSMSSGNLAAGRQELLRLPPFPERSHLRGVLDMFRSRPGAGRNVAVNASNPVERCEMQFFIAETSMATGDRERALRHYRLATLAPLPQSPEYLIARGRLTTRFR